MDWIQTVIIAIVEGLTEFLPVSSTGHMIITQNLLGVPQGDPFVHPSCFPVPCPDVHLCRCVIVTDQVHFC